MTDHSVSWRSRTTFLAVFVLAVAQLGDAFTTRSLLVRRTPSRVEAPWQKRSDDTTVSSAISIAPSQYWEGNDGPWSSFPLQAGAGAVGGLQNVRVLVSTAATAIWTIGPEGCPTNFGSGCPDSRGGLFLPNQSLTWAPNSIYQTGLEMNLGLDSSGYVGYDTSTLGWQGSGGPKVEHSIMWNLADGNYWLGMFGLNPRPTNFTTFTDPQTSFLQTLVNSKKIPSASWAYTAGNQYRLDKVFGSLTLGGYDINRFIPNNVTFPFYSDISRDLSVNLHSLTTSKGSPSNLLPDGSISMFIDSTVPELWLPESACAAFEQAFGIEYNDNYSRYLITAAQREKLLAQSAEIKFTVGNSFGGGETVDITLPYQAFDLQVQFPIVMNPNTSYYFPLRKAANDTQYTLGRTFLQEAYVIADYERWNFSVSQCRWEHGKIGAQNLEDIPSIEAVDSGSNSNKTVLSTAAIAGVAVGAIVVIGIGILIFALIWRRKNAEKRRLAEIQEKNDASSASDADSTQIAISAPMGGELGGGDINEMPHEGRQWIQEVHGTTTRKVGYSEMEGQAYIGHGKGFANEMPANDVVYEMSGSDVHELPNGRMSKTGTVDVQELPNRRFTRMSQNSRPRSRSGWL